MVPEARFELARREAPGPEPGVSSVPPLGFAIWCPERDLNSHGLSAATLSRWCVCQFHHPGNTLDAGAGIEPASTVLQTAPWPLGHPAMIWSRRRGLNSRPPPYEGGALAI